MMPIGAEVRIRKDLKLGVLTKTEIINVLCMLVEVCYY